MFLKLTRQQQQKRTTTKNILFRFIKRLTKNLIQKSNKKRDNKKKKNLLNRMYLQEKIEIH